MHRLSRASYETERWTGAKPAMERPDGVPNDGSANCAFSSGGRQDPSWTKQPLLCWLPPGSLSKYSRASVMRIGIFSDTHANLEALESVLECFRVARVDKLVCLGDTVGYGADPNGCCDLVRKHAARRCSWRAGSLYRCVGEYG